MTPTKPLSGAEIRAQSQDHQTLRSRDLAHKIGVSEAQLVAAGCGTGTTCIAPSPDAIFPLLTGLGEVMALTRNESCVIEKVGIYDNFRSGEQASMVLNGAIDLRMFPAHWVSAFAVETPGDKGTKRSIQVFDAAGDAVHKVHLRDGSDIDHWNRLVAELALPEQSDTLAVAPRDPVEPARSEPAKLDILRKEWARMTDTHQFLRLTSKLRMNRLGAYRIAGEPFARKLPTGAIDSVLTGVAGSGLEVMIFVGNRGCIEIHGGPVETVKPMGPWQNILDPGFNIHLRSDHLAEVWAVTKPTRRGDAVSVEGFDADGALILQVFGRRGGDSDHRPAWNDLVAALPSDHIKETA